VGQTNLCTKRSFEEVYIRRCRGGIRERKGGALLGKAIILIVRELSEKEKKNSDFLFWRCAHRRSLRESPQPAACAMREGGERYILNGGGKRGVGFWIIGPSGREEEGRFFGRTHMLCKKFQGFQNRRRRGFIPGETIRACAVTQGQGRRKVGREKRIANLLAVPGEGWQERGRGFA